MSKTLVSALVFIMASGTTFASNLVYHPKGNYYLIGTFGLYHPQSDTRLGSGPIANFGLGYNINNVVSIQGLFGWANIPDYTNNTDRNSTLSRVEAVAHWNTGHPLVPYAAIGFGLAHIRSSHFMADFGVGSEYFVSEHTAMTFDWRWIRQTNNGQGDYLLTAGITYGFGGTQNIHN